MSTTTPDNLADAATAAAFKDRIGRLEPDIRPQWGEMTAAQMMAHCTEIFDVACGKPLEGTPWYVNLFKGMIRKMVVNDKPYPRSTRTHPQYRQTEDREFEAERVRILAAMDRFTQACQTREYLEHPLFGPMTVEEAGRAMAKHLDHHLEQFGIGSA
jgi:hypothetical protein